jgi:hypothetical protein
MDRIKVKNFLSYSDSEKHSFISLLQMKRKNSIKEAAKKKVRKTSTKKTISKKPAKRKASSQAKAEKLMAKLSDAQILALMEKLS